MQGRNQLPILFLNIISSAATAALAITIAFALTVVLAPSAQAQSPATSGGWTEQVLYQFISNGSPEGSILFDTAGNLYSTTAGGTSFCGTYGYGQVFELTAGPTARSGRWVEKSLHGFNFNGADGVCPEAGLIFDAAGNLYGTTVGGGTYNAGTVFELTPAGGGVWTEKVLHSFVGNSSDGWWPSDGLIFDAAGNLYGTTTTGGTSVYSCTGGCGTVFELSPAADGSWTERVLYNFGGPPDGAVPHDGLIFDAAGNLYGTTYAGGAYSCGQYANGCGTVFELSPIGDGNWAESVLWSFGNGEDGAIPTAGLIFDTAGDLYGTTGAGGSGGGGTVFELSPSQGWEQVLYNFRNTYPPMDGVGPEGGVIFDALGNLYGTTELGGSQDSGTVFELSPSGGGTWTEQLLYNFDGGSGAIPWAGLIFRGGNLYGTTTQGGNYGNGTVFELVRP